MKVSLNTAFDGLASEIGPGNVAQTAWAAGIPETRDGQKTLTSSDGTTHFGIGIGDYPVRPLDQAVAFGTFANGGTAHQGYLVQEVTDAQGHVLYKHKDSGKRAFDSKVANDVTLTLKPVPGFSGVPLDGRDSAAKTGTEGIPSGPDEGRNSDAWMVGYTPQVSTAVWVGSGNSTQAIYNDAGGNEYGRDLPGKAWKAFMDSYLSGKPAESMPSSQQIVNGQDAFTPPPPTPTTTTATPTPTPSTPSTSPSTAPSSRSTSPTPTVTPPTPTTPTPTLTPTTPTPTPTRSRPARSPTPTG
jgi:membrane peptidoglycan carboxypeptidase